MYSDFKELLSALNAHRVRYLIVGGYAVSFHAEPRRERTETTQLETPPVGSRGFEEMLREQARGRENWLELRRKKLERSAAPASERSREKSEFTRESDKGIDDDIES
jgi:hypothetical protein